MRSYDGYDRQNICPVKQKWDKYRTKERRKVSSRLREKGGHIERS